MYNPKAEEFKSSKSAIAAEFEGIESREEEMKAEPSKQLCHRSEKVPQTLWTANERGNLRFLH